MSKKIISVLSLATLLILTGGLLVGCGNQSSNQETVPAADQSAVNTETPAPEQQTQPETPAPVPVSADDLDKAVNELDASMTQVQVTGFEAANLNDKDLGM